jgi:hypothetical protein
MGVAEHNGGNRVVTQDNGAMPETEIMLVKMPREAEAAAEGDQGVVGRCSMKGRS